MEIDFRTSKHKKLYQDYTSLKGKYGSVQAELIITRINELEAAESLYDIKCVPQARLHKLGQNRKGQFAIDIKHPYRIILRPLNGNILDLKTITSIEILEIYIDYH